MRMGERWEKGSESGHVNHSAYDSMDHNILHLQPRVAPRRDRMCRVKAQIIAHAMPGKYQSGRGDFTAFLARQVREGRPRRGA